MDGELHMMNQTPNEFARQAQLWFRGRKRLGPAFTKQLATRISEEDRWSVVGNLIDSSEYGAIHGDRIPLWA
jgi:hypothetical protein